MTVEAAELAELDDRLRFDYGRPVGAPIFLRNPEPDLDRPASRLEDVERPEAPRRGPFVIRGIQGFPAAGAAILDDDDGGDAAAPWAPVIALSAAPLAYFGAADPLPASPPAPFPGIGDPEEDDGAEDDAETRALSAVPAPRTSGSAMVIVPIPGQASPPALSSSDSEDE